MANKINIKVNRVAAIAELQSKLDVLKAKIAEDDAKQAEHEKAIQEWDTSVMNNILLKNYELPTDRGVVIEEYGSGTYRLFLNIKDIQPRPSFHSQISWREREMEKDLERTIRLLGMSVDESVSTKVFDSLGDLL
jgi:hypothetical protein